MKHLPKREHHVWTKDFRGYTCWFTGTWSECRRWILGRPWTGTPGIWPGFAFISKCTTVADFIRYHGE